VLEQDRQNARAAEMDGFASKPLEWGELQREIARCLGLTGDQPPLQRTESTGPIAPNITAAIDWNNAAQRWGDERQLAKAIRTFCADNRPFSARLPQCDPAQARAEAHRIRGAAANLGLPLLANIAASVEQSSDTDQTLAARDLDAAFAQILTEVDQRHPTTATTASSSPQTGPDLALLRQLEQAYLHGAFDDERYATLPRFITPEALSVLDNALDQFDFDAAAKIVRGWINHHSPSPEEE